MKDSEILERLIYRAYVAPGTSAPMEAAALLPFAAAMRLYAKCYAAEEETEKQKLIAATLREFCNGDACPVEYPAPPAESDPDTQQEPSELDGFEPYNRQTDRQTAPPGPMTAKPVRLPTSPVTEQAKSGRSMPS